MRIDSTQQSAVGESQTDSRAREVIDTAHKCFEYIIVCMFTDVCHATEMTSDAVGSGVLRGMGIVPRVL